MSNDTQPRYLDEVTLDQLNPPNVLSIYSINLMLSTGIMVTAARHWSKLRTPFNAAVIWSAFPLFAADICYFFTISRVMSVNANEVVRAMSPVCCAWLMCALACIRFKVFSSAGLASWYSTRVSTCLIAFIYVHGAVSMSLMTASYIEQAHLPAFVTHPWRKLVMVCQFGANVLIDLFIATTTFRIVWGLRKAVIRRRNAAAGPAGSAHSAAGQAGGRRRNDAKGGGVGGNGDQTNANHLATLTVPDMIRTTASGGNAAIPQSMVANIGSQNMGGSGSRSVVRYSTSNSAIPTTAGKDTMGTSATSTPQMSIGVADLVAGSWVSSWQQKSSTASNRAQQQVSKPGKGKLKRARATFQKRSAFVLVLLGLMLFVSIGGIAIFILSTDMFGDALGLLSMRLYIMSTIHLFNNIVDIIH